MLISILGLALANPNLGFASPTPSMDWVEPDPTCSDVPAARGLVDPPATPLPTLQPPRLHCVVTTTAELQTQVSACPYEDIVIAPGRYTPDGLFGDFLTLPRTLRLWSLDSTWTVLEFGISLNVHPGSELHGLQIDLADDEHAIPLYNDPSAPTTAILWWGGPGGEGGDVVIEDTTVRGGNDVSYGILGSKADGVQIRRVGVEGFRRFGIRLYQTGEVTEPALIEDVVIRDVGDPDWRALPTCPTKEGDCYAPGTEEHGLWLGAAATAERVHIRDVWWSGAITGNCGAVCTEDRTGEVVCETVCDEPLTDVHLRHLDIDRIGMGDGLAGAGSGVAYERVTRASDLDTFCIGPNTERGVHMEWNHGDPDEAAVDLTVRNGVIGSSVAGVTLGSGTLGTVVEDVDVWNAWWAGVAMECCGSGDPDTCSTTSIDNVASVPPATAACGFPGGGYTGACSCP